MGSDAEILWPSDNLADTGVPVLQHIRRVLATAIERTRLRAAVGAVLKQFEDEASVGPLLCTMKFQQQRHGAAQHAWRMPDFDTIGWYGQAMAALAAAMVFEPQAQDLATAASQLLQMFLPGVPYQRNQLQQSCRSMGVLLRSLKLCLTSEGQQAVLAAMICLLVLQIFLDSTAALQAVTKEAVSGLKKNRSRPSHLAAWAVTHLTLRGQPECSTIALSGGAEVLVDQLRGPTLVALQGLGLMVEAHSSMVWDALLQLSGLDEVVEHTKGIDLQEEEGVQSLGSIIVGMHTLLEHPHNQAAVLRELERSGILDLFFICAKSQVPQVSQPAVNCLVLIWQWYLRRSPTACFSITQTSCAFLEEEPASPAVAAAPTAMGGGEGEKVDVGVFSPMALPRDARLSPREPPVRAPPPPGTLAAVRVQRPAPKPSSFLASEASGCSPGASAVEQAPPARLNSPPAGFNSPPARRNSPAVHSHCPLLAHAKPRASSARALAQPAAAAVTPVGGGQFVPQHSNGRFSALSSSSSSVTPEPLTGAESLTASSPDPDATVGVDPSKESLVSNQNTAGDFPGKPPRQLIESSSLAASMYQQAHRHGMPHPESCHGVTSMCSSFPRRSSTQVNEAPITPDQLAGQFSRMHLGVSQSSSSASGAPRAKQSGALDRALPQGTCSRPNQAMALPAVHVAAQPLKQQRQRESSQQHSQSCSETHPEGHWQSMPSSYSLPSVEAKAEGLERQSPAESPSTPEHRKPTQRVLHFSPPPMVQSRAESFHATSQGVVADLQHAYPPRLEYGRDPLPLHEDSAWDSNDSEPAWNASASSVVSTSIAESKTSCDTHTHSGNGSLANGCSVGPAEIDDVNMTCLNSRKQHEQGKESRVSKFLHWLADPDNTDAKAVKADRGYY